MLATIAKLPALTKLALIGLAVISTAAIGGFSVQDLTRDYVLFMGLSAVVGGMPDPDTELSGLRFFYTWMYRTGHLLVGSATAFFIHEKKWRDISGESTLEEKTK